MCVVTVILPSVRARLAEMCGIHETQCIRPGLCTLAHLQCSRHTAKDHGIRLPTRMRAVRQGRRVHLARLLIRILRFLYIHCGICVGAWFIAFRLG